MKCDQMKFIFQHSPFCSSQTSSIGVAMLRSHWSNDSSTADMISPYELLLYNYNEGIFMDEE